LAPAVVLALDSLCYATLDHFTSFLIYSDVTVNYNEGAWEKVDKSREGGVKSIHVDSVPRHETTKCIGNKFVLSKSKIWTASSQERNSPRHQNHHCTFLVGEEIIVVQCPADC